MGEDKLVHHRGGGGGKQRLAMISSSLDENLSNQNDDNNGDADDDDDDGLELTDMNYEKEGLLIHEENVDAVIGDGSESSTNIEIFVDSAGGHESIGKPGTATNPQVATNIVISFVGAGILGVPDAFRKAGWLLGCITLLTVSTLNVYAMLLLPQVKKTLRKKQQTICTSYGEVGRKVMGPTGEKIVNICLGISQAGFATAYIIFISANLYSIVQIPRAITCMACIPGLALLVQFRDMKYLSPFSLLANCANFSAMTAVLFQDYETYTNLHDDHIHAVKWDGFLYVIAITIYSMEGIGLILSLESSAKDQKTFPWLLCGMIASISTFMALFGTAGYWAFGDSTMAPVTLNLVEHFWAATFVKCSLCLGLYLTYPIMMFPIWSITDGIFPHLRDNRKLQILFRTSLVSLSALVAYSVPDFGKFLSLVGSSICTLLGFIFPCYFHLKVLKGELAIWQIILDWFLMVGGALFGIMGTYNSFIALLHGELEGE